MFLLIVLALVGAAAGAVDLNTSHVLINLTKMKKYNLSRINLNTSHVLINPLSVVIVPSLIFNLNTSHVLINQNPGMFIHVFIEFKYISCSY